MKEHLKTPTKLFIFIVAAAIALGASQALQSRPPAAQAAAATLSLPTAGCGGTAANVLFSWQPTAGAVEQWIDLSLQDNNWAPGTFIGAGPLATGVANYTWANLAAGQPHFWRVNARTAGGWETSITGAFVPCGGPALLNGPMTCTDTQNAKLDFRWAPMAGPGGAIWLDLGFDGNFSAGTFVGAGPFSPATQGFTWPGVQANVTYYFRVNEQGPDGVWRASQVGSFYAPCAPSHNPNIYGSADVLYSARLGINAPVNVRDVGPDGALGDPVGPEDVVRYNFSMFPGMGGYPGSFGTTVVAGHVDYRNYGLAVFAPLRNVQVGDIFNYYRADGSVVNYAVDWFADIPPNYDWNSLVVSSNPQTMLLITCNGTFNSATREYDQRRAVHLTITQ